MQFPRLSIYKIQIAIFAVFAALSFGVAGFMIVEGFSFLDSLYMSIITFATVGYGEIRELSDAGKVFTIVLIIFYVSIFTFVVSVITSYILDGDLRQKLIKNKMDKIISNLRDHVIVCGYGRNGQKCCEELYRSKVPFIVVESNLKTIERIKERNFLYVYGNATEDIVLNQAGIIYAKDLITALPIDADNVFVVLSARKLNQNLKIISRAALSSSEEKLKTAGANHVVMPEVIGGHYMSALVNRPDLIEFYHLLTEDINASICTEELDCNSFNTELMGKTISEIEFRKKTGVNIIALKNLSGSFEINPTPEVIITPNIKLIVLGTRAQIDELKRIVT